MLRTLRCGLLASAILVAPLSPQAADGPTLAAALESARVGDWVGADTTASAAGDAVVRDIITWLRLQDGQGSWGEYVAFLRNHPDWPNLGAVRAKAEQAMPPGLPPREVTGFFADRQPLTGTGALRLADAHLSAGAKTRAKDVVTFAWSKLDLGSGDLARIAAEWPDVAKKHSETRLDNMIWEGKFGAAQAVFPYVSADLVALARARIAFRTDAKGIDGFVEAVPAALQDDPGFAFDRFQWRMRRDRYAEAMQLMLDQSKSAVALGRPEAWADRRLTLAHRAMREGDAKKAYRLAAQHFTTAGDDYEELEWFAGWLALRKLKDAKTALKHFERFRASVDTPISLGRAGYWIGRAQEVLGDKAAAQEAYGFAAKYQTSFYGQLAAERAGIASDPGLTGSLKADWRTSKFIKRSSGRAALLLSEAGDAGRMWSFLTSLARAEAEPGEMAAIAQMALDLGRPHVAVRVAKIAAGKGIVVMPAYYPVTEVAEVSAGVKPELALAIARQESEFNAEAVSPVGARGLMQLMPATARKVSSDLGLDYSLGRLTSDPVYNVTLGQSYLAGLVGEFGSFPLAAAGYNAGPNRVDSWLAEFGDPRAGRVDMVDWIETIPFYETRNYVMRVMEGLHVYRSRLSGKPAPLRLSADLGIKG